MPLLAQPGGGYAWHPPIGVPLPHFPIVPPGIGPVPGVPPGGITRPIVGPHSTPLGLLHPMHPAARAARAALAARFRY
jgi:hypothetical protein